MEAGGGSSGSADTAADEIAHVSFANVEFLRRYGLNVKNVLEYFYTSPFYLHCGGPSSLNERRRRAGSGEEVRPSGNWHEFTLVHANEDAKDGRVETSIFVIQKVLWREGHEGSVPSEVFYVLSGSIYKAPQIGELFDAAICQAARSADLILRKQLEGVSRKRPRLSLDDSRS
ncbi:unnamed protein product, partial [Polarella glacialis]